MALTTNLLAYWKMEWNSNDSAWSNNGSDTAISYSSGNGKISQGAWFNGSTSRIQLPTNTILNSKSQITINTWITFNDHLTWSLRGIFWVQWNYSGALNSQYISTNGTDQTVAFWVAASSPSPPAMNIGTITTGQWYMLTHTINLSTLVVELFLDWVSKGTQSYSSIPAISVNTVMDIWRVYDTSRIHNGNMDEFAIWNRVLTGSEITQLYNGWAGLTYPFIVNNTQAAFLLLMAL